MRVVIRSVLVHMSVKSVGDAMGWDGMDYQFLGEVVVDEESIARTVVESWNYGRNVGLKVVRLLSRSTCYGYLADWTRDREDQTAAGRRGLSTRRSHGPRWEEVLGPGLVDPGSRNHRGCVRIIDGPGGGDDDVAIVIYYIAKFHKYEDLRTSLDLLTPSPSFPSRTGPKRLEISCCTGPFIDIGQRESIPGTFPCALHGILSKRNGSDREAKEIHPVPTGVMVRYRTRSRRRRNQSR